MRKDLRFRLRSFEFRRCGKFDKKNRRSLKICSGASCAGHSTRRPSSRRHENGQRLAGNVGPNTLVLVTTSPVTNQDSLFTILAPLVLVWESAGSTRRRIRSCFPGCEKTPSTRDSCPWRINDLGQNHDAQRYCARTSDRPAPNAVGVAGPSVRSASKKSCSSSAFSTSSGTEKTG